MERELELVRAVMFSSSRIGSDEVASKSGNGWVRVMSAAMYCYRSLRPQRRLSTRVRSGMTSLRSLSASIVALLEIAEFGVELEGPCLSIFQEMALNAQPRNTRSRAAALIDEGHQFEGDLVEDPNEDDAVHPALSGNNSVVDVSEYVIIGSKASENEEMMIMPGVVGGENVEADGDENTDILDRCNLCVKIGDGDSFILGGKIIFSRFGTSIEISHLHFEVGEGGGTGMAM